jgi:hypothetical protein
VEQRSLEQPVRHRNHDNRGHGHPPPRLPLGESWAAPLSPVHLRLPTPGTRRRLGESSGREVCGPWFGGGSLGRSLHSLLAHRFLAA